jgi:deoxyribose-phosphate aldolase
MNPNQTEDIVAVDYASFIDHTLLDPLAVEADIERLCTEAIQYNFRAVCIHPKWLGLAGFILRQSHSAVATVADFPLGASPHSIRLKQVEHSILDGAQEIDLVAPLDRIKAHDWAALFQDLKSINQLVGTRAFLKVIIEVSLFNDEEIRQTAETCAQAGCHMIKTSTGFINKRPTQLSDIELIKLGAHDYPDVQIKASAGIKTAAQVQEFIKAGVSRIGTSSAVAIMESLQQSV